MNPPGRPVPRGLLALLFCAVMAGAAARGAGDEQILYPGKSVAKAAASAESGGWGSRSLVVGLALAAGGGWLFWRGRRQNPANPVLRSLAVAETRPLGNRQYLVVATYDEKKFLLGVCPGRIDLLASLHEEAKPRS